MTRKPIFSAVESLAPGVWNVPGTIRLMDGLLDLYDAREDDSSLRVSPEGVGLIKQFEGCKLTAYPDPGTGGEPWTIGWGATRIDGKPVKPGMTITQAEADALLMHDIERHADEVRSWIKSAPTTQGQFDALVSFHFNTGDLRRSSLLRKHMEGDYAGAANEFARWKFANGRVLKGLVRRRAAEAARYRA